MATYYVKNTGSDSLTGLSDAQAWATISKVNSVTLSAGDYVLFNSGDTWREMLSVTASGNSGSYVHYGKYGTGNNPRLLGSSKSTSWSNYSGNVWVSSDTFSDPDSFNMYSRSSGGGSEIFFENTNGTVTWGVYKSSIANLTAEYNWFWNSSDSKIYVYAATDPDSRYTSIEIPHGKYIFDLNYMGYIEIKDIDFFYTGEVAIEFDSGDGTWQSKTGLIIDGCEIGYISTKNSEAGYGTQAIYNDMIVRNCEVHDCGRRALSFHHYGSYTSSNILIENNYFHHGWHTTGPDFSVGSGSGMHIQNVTIRRNKFYDDPSISSGSNFMLFQNYSYLSPSVASIDNVYIYSNLFISPGYCGINLEGIQSVYIFNNTFYNHNSNGGAHVWIDKYDDVVQIKNNIFYTTSTLSSDGHAIFITANGRQLTNQISNYNIFYRTSSSYRILENENVAYYGMSDIATLRSDMSWENNGIFSNPLMTDPANSDFTLTSSSPAKAAGTYISTVTVDYNGNSFNASTPSMGAIQYGATSNSYSVIFKIGGIV